MKSYFRAILFVVFLFFFFFFNDTATTEIYTLSLHDALPTYAVAADDESLWIAAGPHHVLRVDPTTNEPSAIIDVCHTPVGVALGEEALWVVTTAERALRIEPHTNTATAEVPIGDPIALTTGKQAVWVSDSRGH